MHTSIRFAPSILIALSIAACAPATPTPVRSAAIGFSIDPQSLSPSLHVGESHALTSRINLREPVVMGVRGDAVTVTFAESGQAGSTLTLDPATLTTRTSTPFRFVDAVREPSHLRAEPATLTLREKRTLECWTDEASSHVVAQLRAQDGTALGPVVTVSTRDAMGAPHAMSSDGTHVVVTFLAVTPEGFDLVATALDAR